MFKHPIEDGDQAGKYTVNIIVDEHADAPWDGEDGHGPVSEWTRREKAPGEMVLNTDRQSHRYYDFAEAVRIARRDGWNAEPYSDNETAVRRAHKAAMADFKRLKAWCDDEWYYVGVIVTHEDGRSESLWGIESDAGEYLTEVANELIAEMETE